jgi:GNAT superfamily N-acetyltransferase
MIKIVEWSDPDQVPQITRLLHEAYAPLAAAGMRYFATHQTEEETLHRLSKGDAFLAIDEEGKIVGTITLSPPGSLGHHCELYGRPGVCVFHQFAVRVDRQRQGIGSALLDHIEAHALEIGATQLACDTAEMAHHLIALYEKRGMHQVGDADWEVTNYQSVLLLKDLGTGA